MKVAFAYNLGLSTNNRSGNNHSGTRSSDTATETKDTIKAIAAAIEEAGHEVEKVEVSGSLTNIVERLETMDPDIIFNIAQGNAGKLREALYPAIFEDLGIPYTGSCGYTNTLTLDKSLTKLVAGRDGVETPRAKIVTSDNLSQLEEQGVGLAFPVIAKPNFEGSSIGIDSGAVAKTPSELFTLLPKIVKAYPDGVLVEEYIEGIDISVGYIHGVGHDQGLLLPVELVMENSDNPFNVYDYRLKNIDPGKVQFRCPALIPRDVAARLRLHSHRVIQSVGLRDVGSIDFRIDKDGRIFLLEVNAIPNFGQRSSLFAASSQLGMTYSQTIAAILNAAALRQKVASASELGVRRRKRNSQPIRVGFTYNVKREHVNGENDDQAEWDPPETIIAISNALARQGHIVVHLEATPDLPRALAEADVDLIFNIAEGVEGRNREAQVPALCELLGIPYTGSDSATLAIALDKALCKKVLMQHDVLTPKFQVMDTGRERLSSDLSFPLIVKPNAEGSSKGIDNANVVDNEDELRAAVRSVLERYRQPAIIEEYISGREFTVGLLGDKRPKVLPAMEIRFLDKSVDRPVYDFTVKQEWERHVYYECPAKITDIERKSIEKVARATFWALDCRDFARVDIRMDNDGNIYVLEVNPLPGLTPDYSDLVLISQGVGMDYDQLMAEVMIGGLRRLRDKRKQERRMEYKRQTESPDSSSKSSKATSTGSKSEKSAKSSSAKSNVSSISSSRKKSDKVQKPNDGLDTGMSVSTH